MNRPHDGGPAFPITTRSSTTGDNDQDLDHSGPRGMSLRDYFAAQVLAGGASEDVGPLDAAERAYTVADFMLKVRQRKNPRFDDPPERHIEDLDEPVPPLDLTPLPPLD